MTLTGLFEHNNWANLELVAACDLLTDAQLDATPVAGSGWSVRRALTHLVEAQAGYLSLLTLPPHERVRASLAFGELRESLVHSGEGLLALARSETREQGQATTRIETTDGYLVEQWLVLVQVLNHATDHRRQACDLLRALGATAPRLDGWAFGEVTGALVPMSGPANTEKRLAGVTIGERTPHDAPIELTPYDPAWPLLYSELADRIRSALSDRVLLLEHVGSTSVPGLSAKPVIDIVLAVRESADEPAYVPDLESRGFALRIREADWFEHRLLRGTDITSNLHVFSAGCPEIQRMLAFRDWLRTHDEDRVLYEKTKVQLAARTWGHVQHYADAKSEVVRAILGRAQGEPE